MTHVSNPLPEHVNQTTGEVLTYKHAWRQARRFDTLAARARTDIKLSARAYQALNQATREQVGEDLRDHYGFLLETLILNSPPSDRRKAEFPKVLKQLGFSPDSTYADKKAALAIQTKEVSHPNQIKFIQHLAAGAEKSRQHNWAWRIQQEEERLYHRGWYPFFITLTLDPTLVDRDEFWRGSNHFKNYIRSIARTAARACGHPPPHKKGPARPFTCPDSEYVRYAASLEHGKSREHHHIHILLWMRNIPEAWKIDPNLGVSDANATYTQCWPLKAYWKYGFSQPCYFRTKNDLWTGLGFKMPVTIEGLKPVGKAGWYLTKYMQKGLKEWKHRMRATRGLGLTKLRDLLYHLPPETTEALSWRPQSSALNHSLSLTHSVPNGLLRSEAKRMTFFNQYLSGQLDLRRQMTPNYAPFIAMLRSVQNGARPDRMPSQQFYDFLTQHLPVQSGYCEKRLTEATVEISHRFPRLVTRAQPTFLKGT